MIRLKNREQLDGIRRSCAMLSELFAYIVPLVKVGVSTGEVDDATRGFIEARGARSWFLGFGDYPASICVSVNEEVGLQRQIKCERSPDSPTNSIQHSH